jgi:uncharacterized protein (TIGR00255 family)
MLPTLLEMPDVLYSEQQELAPQEWAAAEKIVEKAAEQLMEFRKSEGTRLEKDILSRIENIERLASQVKPHLKKRLDAIRDRIEKNIQEFLSGNGTDKNRMEQEIVYYLEKLDITEEQVRLQGHCKYFIETANTKGAPGKKLGFICQEIGREINTMGAKANHVPIQKIVVQMKDELEKIKEQLLNIC